MRGLYAAKPLGELHLIHYGIGYIISGLYSFLPSIPWYGVVLYLALYLAMLLSFGLLHRLCRKRLTNEQVFALLIFFYLLAWFEHALWFNYTRVPVLLAAAAFLNYSFADKTPGPTHNRLLGLNLLAFLLALCIRPNAAVLGLLIALPGAIRVTALAHLDIRNLVTSAVPFFIGTILFSLVITLTRSEEGIAYQTVDRLNMMYNDFGMISLRPRTNSDTARAYAVRAWMIGDREQINERFFHRVGVENWNQYLTTKMPLKLKAASIALSKNYYLIFILNFVLIYVCLRKQRSAPRRRLVWLTQIWVLLLVVGMGGLLKLPPRLLMPTLTVWTLLNILMYFRRRGTGFPKLPLAVWLAMVAIAGFHIYSVGWRIDLLARRRRLNEALFSNLNQQFQRHTLLMAGAETYLAGLSPWTNYSFGKNRVLPLTGWNTLDPSYRRYYTALSGEPSWPRAVRKLAYQPNTVFIVPLGFADRLNQYLRAVQAEPVRLKAFQPQTAPRAGLEITEYLVGVPAGLDAPAWPLVGRLISDSLLLKPVMPGQKP